MRGKQRKIGFVGQNLEALDSHRNKRPGWRDWQAGALARKKVYPRLSLCSSQHWFQVGTDSSRCVTCMVAYSQGVWLALQGSAQVKLYHAQTWESLTEVDVAPAVHKMLAGMQKDFLCVLVVCSIIVLFITFSFFKLVERKCLSFLNFNGVWPLSVINLTLFGPCSGADAIIRQHKAACLRITALLACKDLLWIGTSAGKKTCLNGLTRFLTWICY